MDTSTQHATLIDELTAEFTQIVPAVAPAQARVAVGLWRLLAQGAPVTTRALVERLDLPTQQVAATLDGVFAGTHQRDDHGRVIACWALSLPALPSTHRLDVQGQTLYAWCAPDTLFLPRLLGRTVTVQSALATTGEPISLVVAPHTVQQVSVDGTAVSFVRAVGKDLGDSVPSILSTFCHHQLFFPSQEAGRRWAQARGRADVVLLPIHEAFQLARGWVESIFGAALEPR